MRYWRDLISTFNGQAEFATLCRKLCYQGDVVDLYGFIKKLYSVPDRFYHDLHHVFFMLVVLKSVEWL